MRVRLANVGILGKEREPGVGKLGWHWNFDTGFERNTLSAEISSDTNFVGQKFSSAKNFVTEQFFRHF